MNLQSETLKIIVIMYIGTYLAVWASISIHNGAMYVPPSEYNFTAILATIAQLINGTVGKYLGQQMQA